MLDEDIISVSAINFDHVSAEYGGEEINGGRSAIVVVAGLDVEEGRVGRRFLRSTHYTGAPEHRELPPGWTGGGGLGFLLRLLLIALQIGRGVHDHNRDTEIPSCTVAATSNVVVVVAAAARHNKARHEAALRSGGPRRGVQLLRHLAQTPALQLPGCEQRRIGVAR